ncbi:MAG: hypothetical protein ABSF84_07540 [Acidimicrobiales bacterium]|jgi:hypothetical protein
MTVGITELPPEGMQLPGVALAGDADRGTKTTEGISLLFTTAGVTVQGPQPQIERLLVWTALDTATCHEVVQLTDGREAAILELTSGGQSIRFLLPNNAVSPGQAAYLDQALPTWLARYKGTAAPVAPGSAAAATTATAPGAEVGVALPEPGPVASPEPEPVTSPTPSFATAGVAAATGAGATALDRSAGGGHPNGQGNQGNGSTTAPPPPLAPPGPAAQKPIAPAPSGGVPPSGPLPPVTAWDDPPLAETISDDAAPARKSRFALPRRKTKDADATTDDATAAAAAAAAAVGTANALHAMEPTTVAPAGAPSPTAGLPGGVSPEVAPAASKSPRLSFRRRKAGPDGSDGPGSPDATAAGAGPASPPLAPPTGAVPMAVQPPPPAFPGAAPPLAPPTGAVPMAVQPPPPDPAAPVSGPAGHPIPPGTPIPPGDGPEDGPPESAGVVLADADAPSKRTTRLVLVVILVVVVLGAAGYLAYERSNTTTATPPPASLTPAQSAAADTVTAGAVNLRLSDLPTGWSEVAPAQAVVRPPVAPAAAQAAAAGTMAACLGTSTAVVSGLFGTGSLPDQTSLVQSPTFQSAAGASFEMSSRTAMLASAGEVQALDNVFTNGKFDLCYLQYQGSLVAAAVPDSSVQVQPVTLTGPAGVQSYGVVSTYTVPGTGTEVVGDAFILGGRVVTELQPSTDGPSIPGAVFTPVFDAVTGRVAAASR